jgi:nucleoid-associated protein YgaU
MSLANLFKLEKMRIEGYLDERRRQPTSPAQITLMFNPASYQRRHAVVYNDAKLQALNTEGRPARYALTEPGELKLKLVIDGTGVHQFGAEQLLGPVSVKKKVAEFEKMCLRMNGDIHQPHFLVERWGDFSYQGRRQTLDISYTLFDQSGDPLRAELDVSFIEDRATETAARAAAKSSPDLTHVRTVQAGDTLPLLCVSIYGSASHYLLVARHNGLDDFRQLQPGQQIQRKQGRITGHGQQVVVRGSALRQGGVEPSQGSGESADGIHPDRHAPAGIQRLVAVGVDRQRARYAQCLLLQTL